MTYMEAIEIVRRAQAIARADHQAHMQTSAQLDDALRLLDDDARRARWRARSAARAVVGGSARRGRIRGRRR
jgi:hypothetical protein